MTDLSFAEDAGEHHHVEDTASDASQSAEQVTAPEPPADGGAVEEAPPSPEDVQPEAAQPEAIAHVSAASVVETQQQATQDALFVADVAPTAVDESDDTVTSFGGAPDDLEAIRTELGSDEPAEPAEDSDVSAETAAATGGAAAAVASSAEEAEQEAAEALVAAGVPEGADDDPDAVEALLDAEAEEGLLVVERPDRTLSLPFFVYDGVWLVFAIAMVVVLRDAAVAGALDTAQAYPLFVLAGLVLTVVGPLMSLVVWWVARGRAEGDGRRGLLAVALLRGSLATFAGVVLWWAALVLLNYFKTGRFF